MMDYLSVRMFSVYIAPLGWLFACIARSERCMAVLKRWLARREFFAIQNKFKSVYMRRHFLRRGKRLRVYVHEILRGDSDPDLHDHPWTFFSLILAGGYWERTADNYVFHKPGTILFRPAHVPHQVDVDGTAWSLVLAGRKSRDWGFHTIRGWCQWQRYLSNKCNDEDGLIPADRHVFERP